MQFPAIVAQRGFRKRNNDIVVREGEGGNERLYERPGLVQIRL